MKFEVDAGGRQRSVTVERATEGGRFRVIVDGQAREVDAQATDLGLSLRLAADGRTVNAAATEGPGGEWLIQLPHVDVPVVVDGRRRAGGRHQAAGGHGQQRVTAPMPGRVLRVLVRAGDHVEHRQGLVVIEAMKMENELTAPKAGRVIDVAISEGISVEAGRLLVVIE